jgi:molecular chaperone GrpE
MCQIEDAKIFGIQSFVKDLLDVADVLNKAVSAGNGAGNNTSMLEGLKLTESQLLQVFKRHGLEQVNPLNEKFDPNKHEALFQIPNPNVDANTVLDVQKIGYQLHGRTIRPALVGVSKK